MEEFWIQLLVILTLLSQTFSASDTHELIGAVGGSVTFRSPKTDTGGNGALWSFENERIVTVLFKDPSQSVFSKEEYKTRFTVSKRGRALSISQLRMEDAGTYSVNIHGKLFTFTLHVYRELTEPTVICEAQDCSGSICSFSLRCSVPGAGFGDVSYTWRGWGQRWNAGSLVLAGVDKSSLDNVELLTCTAVNAVSSRNVTVTIPGGLCPGTPSDISVRIGVIVGIPVVLILSVFLVLFCKSRVTTAKSTTVFGEVGSSQPHIPNGIKSKHTAGESSSTIYTLVKKPEQVENVTATGLELLLRTWSCF